MWSCSSPGPLPSPVPSHPCTQAPSAHCWHRESPRLPSRDAIPAPPRSSGLWCDTPLSERHPCVRWLSLPPTHQQTEGRDQSLPVKCTATSKGRGPCWFRDKAAWVQILPRPGYPYKMSTCLSLCKFMRLQHGLIEERYSEQAPTIALIPPTPLTPTSTPQSQPRPGLQEEPAFLRRV